MISFVGAGPGAADLITLRGRDRLAAADLIVWASSLVPEELLTHANPEAPVYDSAAMTLEDVLQIYEAHPDARIVRLHSGDPSLYGAIQEQIDYCRARGRDFEIVPGVSSLGAAAAVIGKELTRPATAQSVIITRLGGGRTGGYIPYEQSVAALSASGATMAVFLSAARPEMLQYELLCPGSLYSDSTPAAIVARATWPDQQIVMTTVGRLPADLRALGTTTTVLVIVGTALAGAAPRSHLYSPDFAHKFRRRSDPGSTRGRPA